MIGATFDEVGQYTVDDEPVEIYHHQQQHQQQHHQQHVQHHPVQATMSTMLPPSLAAVTRCVHCLQRPVNTRCDNGRCARCCAQTGIHCSGHSGLSASNRVDRSALVGAHFAAFIEGSVPGGYRLTAQLGDRLFKGVIFTGPAAVRANVLVQTSNDGSLIDKEGGVRLSDTPIFDAQQRALFHPDAQAQNIEREKALQLQQQQQLQPTFQPSFTYQGQEESANEYGELLVRRYRTLGIPLSRLDHTGDYWRAMRVPESVSTQAIPSTGIPVAVPRFPVVADSAPRKRKPYVKSGNSSHLLISSDDID